MGVSEAFQAVVNLVRHGYLHEQNIPLDKIRSEYPFPGNTDTGYLSFTAGSAGPLDSFDVAVPSGHMYHVKMLQIFNPAEAQVYRLFDGPGVSVPLLAPIPVAQSDMIFLGERELIGVIAQSVLCASATSSAGHLRIGGLIRERTGE